MTSLDRIGGWALVGAAAGVLLAMSHHPTHVTANGLGEAVHAMMILLLAVTAFGYACFAIGWGPARPAILGGLIAFGVAVLAGIAAATINGFVFPAIADASRDTANLAWAMNQAFARLGAFATAAAIFLWSADLVVSGSKPARAVAAAGFAAAILPPGLLILGMVQMNVVGAMLIYGVQTLWAAALGLLMLAGKTRPTQPE